MDLQSLEDWLVAASAPPSSNSQAQASAKAPGALPAARQIAEAWGKIRECVQQGVLDISHAEALSLIERQHSSIHVADSHVKLLLAVLTAVRCENVELLGQARAGSTLVLSAWVRKTFLNTTAKPLKQAEDLLHVLIESACKSLQDRPVSDAYLNRTILLLGLVCSLPHISDGQRDMCQSLLSVELLARKHVIVQGELSVVLAGVGYAMTGGHGSSSVSVLSAVLSLWSLDNEGLDFRDVQGPPLRVALMIFHLLEYVGLAIFSKKNIHALAVLGAVATDIAQRTSGMSPLATKCAAVMAAAGLRRGLIQSRTGSSNSPVEQEMQRLILSLELEVVRICEDAMKHLEQSKIYPTPGDVKWKFSESALKHMHRCTALAVARSRGLPCHPAILQCLAITLLTDVLSLQDVYSAQIEDLKRPLSDVHQFGSALGFAMQRLELHVDSSLFHEAGAIARAMCEQYKPVTEEYQNRSELLVWQFTQELYIGHRTFTVLGGRPSGSGNEAVEKILISSFMTVLVFYSRAIDAQAGMQAGNLVIAEKAARALDSLGCVEFCRRIQMQDYGILVERCVSYLSEHPSAARAYVGFIPPYDNVVHWPGPSALNNMSYDWSRDEVQTARISFYLRVLPSFLSNVPEVTFSNDIAPLMFLYLQHPTEVVVNAAHALFAYFLGLESSEPSSDRVDVFGLEPAQVNLREKLSIYYVTRALETFPGVTPFDALVYGVAAVSKNLPPGSPATLHCINLLVQKASTLKPMSSGVGRQKIGGAEEELDDLGDAEKLQLLLLHLIRRVDLQVLPELLRQTAQLILGLPPQARTAALQNAFEVVAGSSDYMRKPIVIPWLQSVAYLATHPTALTASSKNESATLQGEGSSEGAGSIQGSVSINPSMGIIVAGEHRFSSVRQQQSLHSCL
ncbi:hypothetical protein KC19_5G180500 [Ceratodon purpureus]|uniref:Uncharacterized protein n=1 Tax=Ceratodon purpureus TaxID=3225 RepID=A0A8T0I4V6_CERPU|nr:hypothetical protein KC19_5G180500 [Ceratodon purpureus]